MCRSWAAARRFNCPPPGRRPRCSRRPTSSYKWQTARVAFDERDNILVGCLLGIGDIVGFHAASVAELRAAFEKTADDYLEACAMLAKPAENPPAAS